VYNYKRQGWKYGTGSNKKRQGWKYGTGSKRKDRAGSMGLGVKEKTGLETAVAARYCGTGNKTDRAGKCRKAIWEN